MVTAGGRMHGCMQACRHKTLQVSQLHDNHAICVVTAPRSGGTQEVCMSTRQYSWLLYNVYATHVRGGP